MKQRGGGLGIRCQEGRPPVIKEGETRTPGGKVVGGGLLGLFTHLLPTR